MGSDIETEELRNCLKVIKWNRRFLQLLGVWPLKVYDPMFAFVFAYLFLHCVLTVINIPTYVKDVDLIIASLSEVMMILSTLIRLTICRLSKESLTEFLLEIEDDFTTKNYRNRKEILTFISYNKLAFLFIAVVMPFTAIIALAYYMRSLGTNIKMVIENSSVGYQLPYKTRPIVQIDDVMTYTFYCIYQSLYVPFVIFGYVGYDGLFVTLSLHVTGQLSVLNNRVKDVLNEPYSYRHQIKKLVVRHERLIRNENDALNLFFLYLMFRRLADILEEDFNMGNLQQFLITMWNLCMTSYNVLVTTSNSHSAKLIIYTGFALTILSTVFMYCNIGEGLTQESTKFGQAFYDSEWYNISQTDLKLVLICMMRSSKPLKLTAGKFAVLSLNTFTNIIKTTMGYFSVMRTLL